MMAGTNLVNFFNPEASGQQQLLAQLIQEQQAAPNPTQVVSGRVVPYTAANGMLDAANKVANQWRIGQLMKQQQEQQMNMLSPLFNGSSSATQGAALGAALAPPAPDSGGMTTSAPDVPNASAQRMGSLMSEAPPAPQQDAPQMPQQQPGILNMQGMTPQQSQSLFMMDPNAYMTSFYAAHGPTDAMKNNAYMGISPQAARAIAMQGAFDKSIPQGMQAMVDPNGVAQAQVIPGALQGAAAMTGATEGAKYSPVQDSQGRTIPMPQGAAYSQYQQQNLQPPQPLAPVNPPSAFPMEGSQQQLPPVGPSPMQGQPGMPPIGAPPRIGYGDAEKAAAAGQSKELTDTGANIADAKKTYDVMSSNYPLLKQRLDEMRGYAKNADFGTWTTDENLNGVLPAIHRTFQDKTSVANDRLRQLEAQAIMPELGPQLAAAGIKGNKFLEQLSSNSSGLTKNAAPNSRLDQIDGLEQNYLNNMMAAKAKIGTMTGGQQPPLPAIGSQQNQPIAKVVGGQNFIKINGKWFQQ